MSGQDLGGGPAALRRQAQRLRDRRQRQGGVVQRGEVDEDGAVGEAFVGRMGGVQGQTRLPDAARPDQRERAEVVAPQQGVYLRRLALAPDQRGWWEGQRAGSARAR